MAYRRTQLAELADQALELLMKQAPVNARNTEPAERDDVLIKAWVNLAEDVDYRPRNCSVSKCPRRTEHEQSMCLIIRPVEETCRSFASVMI